MTSHTWWAHSRRWMAGASVLAVVTLAGCSSDAGSDSGPQAVGGSVIELPDQVGDLWVYSEACEKTYDDSPDQLSSCLESAAGMAPTYQDWAQRISAAYGGADAGAGYYTTEGLGAGVDAVVVRGDTPGLWSKDQGEAWEERAGVHEMHPVSTVDGVDCRLNPDVTVTLDGEAGPQDYSLAMCQKSADGLTVQLHFFNIDTTDVFPVSEGAEWTNALYDAVA
ncbi:hypothetical protein [Demequina sp.]|uniref:hypothetical protein n=1 Tax=Demequina sp. TaxID=2050685 RepID=UPI0025C31D64|nr:hypothetical protein [Demequina sp.]